MLIPGGLLPLLSSADPAEEKAEEKAFAPHAQRRKQSAGLTAAIDRPPTG
jgi:hypothetical protein